VSGYTEYYICCCGFKRGCCRCDPFAWREDDDDAPPLGEILPRAEGRGQQGAPPANNPAPQPLLPGRSLPCIALRGCCRLRPSCHRRGAATLPASPQRAHQYFCCCWHSNPAASARQRSQPTPLSAPPAAPKLLQLCATRDFAKSIFPPSLSLSCSCSLGREQPCSVCVCAMCTYVLLPACFVCSKLLGNQPKVHHFYALVRENCFCNARCIAVYLSQKRGLFHFWHIFAMPCLIFPQHSSIAEITPDAKMEYMTIFLFTNIGGIFHLY
jgi:hypothetical protein